jgi:hypothetical protein
MPTLSLPYCSELVVPSGGNRLGAFNGAASLPWGVKTAKGSDNGNSITGPQVYIDKSTGTLPHNNLWRQFGRHRRWVDFNKSRTMRRHPTIALAREVGVSPIVGSSWTLKVKEDHPKLEEIKKYCDKYLLPLRNKFLRTALLGEMDFGWRAYEKILNAVKDKTLGTVVVLQRIKALLNDTTWVHYDDDGDYDGLLHQNPLSGEWVWIDRAYSLFANFDDDGLGYYNEPRLLRAEQAHDEWNRISDVARRFNEKFAGAVWVIHYPEGKSTWRGKTGVDNREVALEILYSIKSAGYLALPNKLLADAQGEMDQLGQPGWRVEIIESSSKQGDFTTGQEYQDKLMIRAMGVLERTITEGHYGTKAESESHVNVMLLNMQLKHEDLTEFFNREAVDHMLIENFGEPGIVEYEAQPLTDERSDLFQTILTAMLSSPEQQAEIFDKLNLQEILKHLRLPQLSEQDLAAMNGGSGLFKLITDAINSGQQPANSNEPIDNGGPSPADTLAEAN